MNMNDTYYNGVQSKAQETALRIEIFKDKITYLDCALTQKKYSQCLHTYRNAPEKMKDPLNWILSSDIYYLSDGGYSRISTTWNGEDFDSVNIHLSSESRKETKESWERCKELISDVEDSIKIAVRIEQGC